MIRSIINRLPLWVALIIALFIMPGVALAQEGGPQPDPYPLDQTLIWLIGLLANLAVYSLAVPTALQVAKEQFLDKVLVFLWTFIRSLLGLFLDEKAPEFQTAFSTIRSWVIVFVVGFGAYAVALENDALMTGAPDNIAALPEVYLRVGFTVLLSGGAFLFHKKVIKDMFPVEKPTFTANGAPVVVEHQGLAAQ